MTPPECPGCGLTIRAGCDAIRDDDARLCPDGRCHGVDPISRVRASRAGGYSTLDLDPRDVDALLAVYDDAREEIVRAQSGETHAVDARDAAVIRADAMQRTVEHMIAEHAALIGCDPTMTDVVEALRAIAGDRSALRAEVARLRAYFAEKAREVEVAHGHDHSCTAVRHPGHPFEGCDCLVADVERGSMGDVLHRLWQTELERDAARAEAAGLRAIVEGRTVVPTTPEEIDAHEAAGGQWLYDYRGRMLSVIASDVALRVEAEGCRSGQIVDSRWWPLDATGRPCPWPVTP